jgi:hypothetical protein
MLEKGTHNSVDNMNTIDVCYIQPNVTPPIFLFNDHERATVTVFRRRALRTSIARIKRRKMDKQLM